MNTKLLTILGSSIAMIALAHSQTYTQSFTSSDLSGLAFSTYNYSTVGFAAANGGSATYSVTSITGGINYNYSGTNPSGTGGSLRAIFSIPSFTWTVPANATVTGLAGSIDYQEGNYTGIDPVVSMVFSKDNGSTWMFASGSGAVNLIPSNNTANNTTWSTGSVALDPTTLAEIGTTNYTTLQPGDNVLIGLNFANSGASFTNRDLNLKNYSPSISYTIAAVPEPSAALLGIMGSLGLVLRRRR